MITLDHGDRRYENFTREGLLDAGVPVAAIDAAELGGAKASALRSIDAAAEAARGRHVTLIGGQEMTYLRKEQQARAYLGLTAALRAAADPAAYAMLLPEAEALGIDPLVQAQTVVARADGWTVLGGLIEAARAAGRADVNARLKHHTVAEARDAAVDTLNAF